MLGTSCGYSYSSTFLEYVHSTIVNCTSLILFFLSSLFFFLFLLIHSLRLIVDAFTCLLERFVCMEIVVAVTTPYHSIAWLSDSRWKKNERERERGRETTIEVNFYSTHTHIYTYIRVISCRPFPRQIGSHSLFVFKNDLSLSLSFFFMPIIQSEYLMWTCAEYKSY